MESKTAANTAEANETSATGRLALNVGSRVEVLQPGVPQFYLPALLETKSGDWFTVKYDKDQSGRTFLESEVPVSRIKPISPPVKPENLNIESCKVNMRQTRASNRGFVFTCKRTHSYHAVEVDDNSDSAESIAGASDDNGESRWLNLACETCAMKDCAERMIICDRCEKGYHTFCLDPPLSKVPAGRWACDKCPSKKRGLFSPRKSCLADWLCDDGDVGGEGQEELLKADGENCSSVRNTERNCRAKKRHKIIAKRRKRRKKQKLQRFVQASSATQRPALTAKFTTCQVLASPATFSHCTPGNGPLSGALGGLKSVFNNTACSSDQQAAGQILASAREGVLALASRK
jgi:hypothetical protein